MIQQARCALRGAPNQQASQAVSDKAAYAAQVLEDELSRQRTARAVWPAGLSR